MKTALSAFWLFALALSVSFGGGIRPADQALGQEPVISLEEATAETGESPAGELVQKRIFLTPPNDTIKLLNLPSEHTVWVFPNKTNEEVVAILRNAGFTNPQIDFFSNWEAAYADSEQIKLFPSAQFVISLPPLVRSALYRVLSQWESNYFARHPIYLGPGWSETTDLKPEWTQVITQLAYQRGDTQLFSDVSVLLSMVNSPEEEFAMLRALLRTPNTTLKLRITPECDKEGITNYWSLGGQRSDILPMLESIFQTEDEKFLDISSLLPPAPRSYYATFPQIGDGLEGRYPDGMWTALNFLNATQLPLYDGLTETGQYLQKHFAPTKAPYQLGDVLFLITPGQNRAVHACIHIADDVVFTKNSPSLLSPWVFMPLKEVIKIHQREQKLQIAARRRKS